MTFDRPNSQLPVRTLQKQDINQAGLAALGNSVSSAGVQVLRDEARAAATQAALDKAIETRRRKLEAYDAYVEFSSTQQKGLQNIVETENDFAKQREDGLTFQDENLQTFRDKSIERNYAPEFIALAGPKFITVQEKFLTKN